MDRIAQDDANFSGNGLNLGHIIDWLFGLSIAFHTDLVRFDRQKGLDCGTKITDVLICSLNFSPDKRKSFIRRYAFARHSVCLSATPVAPCCTRLECTRWMALMVMASSLAPFCEGTDNGCAKSGFPF